MRTRIPNLARYTLTLFCAAFVLLLASATLTPTTHVGQASPKPEPVSAAPVPAIKKGIAKYYAPGVMERVARNRRMKMRTDVQGYASTPDCWRIGQIIYASINNGRWERYQVLDCSHPRDRPRHIRQGLVIEVDYRSAVRNRFVSQGKAPAIVVYP